MDSPGVNCVDRHKEKDPSWVIWEKDKPPKGIVPRGSQLEKISVHPRIFNEKIWKNMKKYWKY